MARKLSLRGVFRNTRPVWEMGLGALLALLLAFAAMNLAWMAVHIGHTVLIILVLGACYCLYLIRHSFRLAYGTAEMMIGLSAIFGAMGRAPEVVSDPATGTLLLVQLAAGMYIIIRGFDNFAQTEPFKGGSAPFRAVWTFIRGRKRKE